MLAGQALADDQRDEEILHRAEPLGIPVEKAGDVLSRVRRKTRAEMEGAYALLREILDFFIEKNYSIWKTRNELKSAPAKQDRVLSQITQLMYSYNLTVDLETERYTLITGTGMERTVDEYKKHAHQQDLRHFQAGIIHPAYLGAFNQLLDFSAAKRPASPSSP